MINVNLDLHIDKLYKWILNKIRKFICPKKRNKIILSLTTKDYLSNMMYDLEEDEEIRKLERFKKYK